MKKIAISFIHIFFLYGALFAQLENSKGTNKEEGADFTLPSADYPIVNNNTYEFKARDYVSLKPGFEYSPTGDNYFLGIINPFLIFPPEEGEYGGSPNNNEGGVVGTIPGTFAVSPTGAATYTIPIEVPAGINGMTPQLALVYNSQAPSGILGKGWGLNGLSYIGRAARSYYHGNGVPKGVDYNDDQLVWDGNMLILDHTSGNDKFYRTERDGGTQIHFFDATNSFVIKTNAGIEYHYGYDENGYNDEGKNNSKQRINNSNESTLRWYLAKVVDKNGNEILYQYIHPNPAEGEIYLSEIFYYDYKIKFEYNTFTDLFYQSVYVSDVEGNLDYSFKLSLCMSEIYITHDNDNLIYKYHLNYTTGGTKDKDYLADISLSRIAPNINQHFNSTHFDWEFYDVNHSIAESTTVHNKPSSVIEYKFESKAADFNGDGTDDIMDYERKNNPNIKLYISPLNNISIDNSIVGGATDYTYLLADINGDGKVEIVFHKNGKLRFINIPLYLNTREVNNISQADVIETQFSYTPYEVGDFNGDGIDDLIVKSDNPNKFRILFGDPNDSDFLTMGGLIAEFEIPYNSVNIVDFNGDGKNELIVLESNYWYKRELNANNTSFNSTQLAFTYSQKIRVGDINGDQKTDILLKESQNSFTPYFSTGNGFTAGNEVNLGFDFTKLEVGDLDSDNISDLYALIDAPINDSINKFTLKKLINCGNGTLFYGFSTHLFDYKKYFYHNCDDGWGTTYFKKMKKIEYYNKLILGDFNGDKIMDFYINHKIIRFYDAAECGAPYPLWTKDQYEPYSFLSYKSVVVTNGEKYNAITKITDGLGIETNINYKPLNQYAYYWFSESSEYFPVNNFATPKFPVVSTSNVNPTKDGYLNNHRYDYVGAIYHRQGLGFLGFENISDLNVSKSLITSTHNDIYINSNKMYYPYPQKVEQSFFPIGKAQVLLSKTVNQISHINPIGNDLVYIPSISESLNWTWDMDNNGNQVAISTQKSMATIDEFGNMTEKITLSAEGNLGENPDDEDFTYSTQTIMEYEDSPSGEWLNSRIELTKTYTPQLTDFKVNENCAASFNKYTYDDNKPWLLTSRTTIPYLSFIPTADGIGPSYEVVNEFSTMECYTTDGTSNGMPAYDNHGNLEKKTISGESVDDFSVPEKITEYEYSDDGRFLTRIKKTRDNTEYVETFDYDPITGNKILELSSNGNGEKFVYDDFWKLKETIDVWKDPNNSSAPIVEGVKKISVLRWVTTEPDAPDFGNPIYYSWSQTSGETPIVRFYNKFGNELRSVTQGFNGDKIYRDKDYGCDGIIDKSYEPYFSYNSKDKYIEYSYDPLKRIEEKTLPTGTIISYTYEGRTSKVKKSLDDIDLETTTKVNSLGQTKEIIDPSGSSITYEYFSSGNVKSIAAAGGATTMTYDNGGNQTELIDPDAGLTTYVYDSYGRLRKQTDANGTDTELTYDGLDRITDKIVTAGDDVQGGNKTITNTYITNSSQHGFGQLLSTTMDNTSYQYEYDNRGRLIKEMESITETGGGNKTFFNKYTYDIFGRNKTQTYPDGTQTKEYYNNLGFHIKTKEIGNSLTLWEVMDVNERGQTSWYTQNGINTHKTYDEYGLLTNINTDNGAIQDLSYEFNQYTGNLEKREDFTNGLSLTENFEYDNVLHSRLTDWGATGQELQSISFSNNGNIESKSDVADIYNYDGDGPHAVSGLETLDPKYQTMINGQDQNITYNVFQKIHSIVQGNKRLEFGYGPDEQRTIMRYYLDDVLQETKYYILGNYEIEKDEINNEEKALQYIAGIKVKEYNSAGGNNTYFLYTDYLGNLQTIVDESGTIIERLAFDPWGRRRNPTTWANLTADEIENTNFTFDRGYTGHEHLDAFGIINMNGRLYDPYLGRMLSPDNFVQNPGYAQNYNRYSYAYNNPLRYTDPDGEIVWAPIIIGAIFGGYSGYQIGKAANATGLEMAGYIIGGAFIGGLSGGTASAISGAGGSALIAGASGGLINGGGFAALQGKSIGKGMITGALSGGLGGYAGATIGGAGGAFVGGALGSGTNVFLNGGTGEDAITSAIIGGGISVGAYYASSYIGWKLQGGNKMGDLDVNFKTYLKMQSVSQQSRSLKKEMGFWIDANGNPTKTMIGDASSVDLGLAPEGATGEFHTHWEKPGISYIQDRNGDWVKESTFVNHGEGFQTLKMQVLGLHSSTDLGHGYKSVVLNRYSGSYQAGGSYYPGKGSYLYVSPIYNSPINHFIYSFLLWRN